MPRTRSRTASASAATLGRFVFTLGLLPFKVNPPVLIWDAAASVLVVVVEVWRQDHRLWLRLGSLASHATSVAGLSSVSPGVLHGPPHKHPPSHVEERQAASLSLLAEPANDGVNVGLAPLDTLAVHLGGPGVAGAVGRGGDADAGEELF
jgi:hypothetical protein